MTTPIEFCEDCRHHHIPGTCDPNDLTEQGWNAYKASKAVAFPKKTSGQDLKERQQ